MIKKIKKPNIDFNFPIHNDYKFYYNEENHEYYIKYKYKSKRYFNLNGKLHRIEKPAIEFYDGRKWWIENGKEHRLDGPAYIYNSYKNYWINDKNYTKKEFAKETNHLICKLCCNFCKQTCF